ncbi:MAG: M16 family metallopeptidase [Gammaproteobacteria bacterium]
MKKPISVTALLTLLSAISTNLFASPEIQSWTTANGVRVYFVEAPEIPMLDIRLVFKAGSAQDGAKHGIANLTSSLMDEGAGDMDANAFNEQLADTGASFGAGALRDMAWLSLRTLSEKEYSEPAIALFRKVATSPLFAEAAVERAKAQTISRIRRDASSPGSTANKAIRKAIFGEHPYAHPVEGEEATLATITRQDIVEFHRKYYVAENAVLAMVGAMDRPQAEKLGQQIAEILLRGKPAGPIAEVELLDKRTAEHLEFDSIQSHIRLGMPGMKRGDKDYVPLFVGNHVLGGGGLVSLLFDEVREKRGLSYGVNSYFSPSEQLGVFVASLQTDGSQAGQALEVLTDTIQTFIQDGPPPERLEAAKQNLIGGWPLRFDSNSEIIEYIAMIGFYGLPLDYLKTFPEKVAATDAAQIKDAFSRRIDLTRAAIVVVGQTADQKSGT